MERQGYQSDVWAVRHSQSLSGNARTTLRWTPSAATGTANPSTMSNTGKHEIVGGTRAARIKKLVFLVDTETTAADATTSKVNFLVYQNTTAKGTLSVNAQAALAVVTSSDLDIDLAAGDYIRIYSNSIQTGSDKAAAIGALTVLYEERFTNV